MRATRILALTALMLASLPGAGCRCRSTEGSLPDAGAPSTLVIRIPSEPVGLTRIHDRMTDGLTVRLFTGTVYQTLATVNHEHPEAPLVPQLARAWALDASGKTLSIRLATGTLFHSGHAFSSADLVAELNAIRDPQNPTAGMRAALGDIERIDAPDPKTLVVTWREVQPLAQRALLAGLPVMSAPSLQGPFDALAVHRAPDGTGPFRLTSWRPGDSLTLERTPTGTARVQRIELRIAKDEAVAVQRWRAGEFDLMTRLAPETFELMKSARPEDAWAREYQPLVVPENTWSILVWNVRRGALSDVRVRQALALAYPADDVSRVTDRGFEQRVTCPYARESQACDATVAPLAFDLEAAKRALESAGVVDGDHDGWREWHGHKVELSFLLNAASVKARKLLDLYAQSLQRIGIAVTVNAVDPAAFVAQLRAHEFDAAPLSWSNLDVVSDAFDLFHGSQSAEGKNYGGLHDDDLDAMLTAARQETNAEKLVSLQRQIHRRVFELQPGLFLTTRPSLDAAKKRVHGLVPSIAWYDLTQVWVDP